MRSRLPAVLHPLAGRPLCWHTLDTIARLDRPPDRLVLIGGEEIPTDIYRDIPLEVVTADADSWKEAVETDRVVLVEILAAALHRSLRRIVRSGEPGLLVGPDGRVAVASIAKEEAPDGLGGEDPLQPLVPTLPDRREDADAEEVFVVRDRCALARAAEILRDRIVNRLMRSGVTFMLPATVLVEVDVRIGRDSVVYPGAVLEGETVVGEETVIGPGCRIISSQVGSGVELKGWNYISHTTVRNRAILEPYVRRGYD